MMTGRLGSAHPWLTAFALAVLFSACASYEKPKPTPLEAFTSSLAVRTHWKANVGRLSAVLRPVAVGDVVIVATQDGSVVSLDAATGASRSRVSVGAVLSAGVGSDGRLSAVVTRDNELVVVDATRILWRARLRTTVVTPPLVAGERVFVQGVDRAIEAFDAEDGRKLWRFSRASDPLALSQPGVLIPFKDNLLVGSGTKLLSLDPLLGAVRGEVALASPRGVNEVERLADLVGPAGRQADTVCARAFQSAVACVNADRQTLLWNRPSSGYQGLAVDADFVFGADGSDRLTAWRRSTGDLQWSSDRLRYRELSAPVTLGSVVVFGDGEGHVHFLSRDKGEVRQRLSTDSSGISAPLLRVGQTLVAVTRAGAVYGFRTGTD
jgi:outer membrane protein assembly factor BamB